MNTNETQVSNEYNISKNNYNVESKLKTFFTAKKEVIDGKKIMHFPTSTEKTVSFCTLMKLLAITRILFQSSTNLKIEKLFLIIADDTNDGRELAQLLSYGERVNLAEPFLYAKTFELYELFMKNHYLYYNQLIKTHILVYPRNAPNPLLATYLTKAIIRSSEKIKIALTCKKEINKVVLNSLFLTASEILEFDLDRNYLQIQKSIIIMPSNTEDGFTSFGKIKEEINKYIFEKFVRYKSINLFSWFNNASNLKNLHFKEQLEYLVLGFVNTNFFSKLPNIYSEENVLNDDFVPTKWNIIKIRELLFINMSIVKCIIYSNSQQRKLKRNILATDIKSLKGLLSFPNWINNLEQESQET
ncbi:uncharacterized protein LOC122507769 isoform X1 [Leptopilina heterotoma]|uniref:uncharacterized protein LOC122507769 isoform X1 n=1 Tax=Leptopilina heterotoma TaxID=63436 RepID=UPI001CA81BD6|nr:uncharacterized protein LOC122507769 isoform X1 [Leptopilina heterotoma]